MSWHVYYLSDGALQSTGNANAAGASLPAGLGEIERTKASKWHHVWNPVTRDFDSNEGDTIFTVSEFYSLFTDDERQSFHASVKVAVAAVQRTVEFYASAGKLVKINHPLIEVVFLDPLVTASIITSARKTEIMASRR